MPLPYKGFICVSEANYEKRILVQMTCLDDYNEKKVLQIGLDCSETDTYETTKTYLSNYKKMKL